MIDREQRIGVLIPAGKHIRGVVENELHACGFSYKLVKNGSLHAHVLNAPVDLTVQNHRDIIGHIDRGLYEGGFVGSDAYQEYLFSLSEGMPPRVAVVGSFQLFDPDVRISLLVRKDNRFDRILYKKVLDLEGQRVVTTYENLTKKFFDQCFPTDKKRPVIDAKLTGKEEGQVAGRKAEACVVVVHTGSAMKENNLRELTTIMRDIQPLLIYNPEAVLAKGDQRVWEQFLDRLQNCDRPSNNLSRLPGLPLVRV